MPSLRSRDPLIARPQLRCQAPLRAPSRAYLAPPRFCFAGAKSRQGRDLPPDLSEQLLVAREKYSPPHPDGLGLDTLRPAAPELAPYPVAISTALPSLSLPPAPHPFAT